MLLSRVSTARVTLYTLLSFSINIKLEFLVLIYYIILLTCLAFLRIKKIVIILLIDNITITSKAFNRLDFDTFSFNLLRIIYS